MVGNAIGRVNDCHDYCDDVFSATLKELIMTTDFIHQVAEIWQNYFPKSEEPIAVFYADTLHGATYPSKPMENHKGYTCLYAQLNRLHKGEALAFDPENLGCFGAMKSIYGGYNEEAEVKLLVEIERFKADRDCVKAMCSVNPKASPKGRYIVFKPWSTLTEEDTPEIVCLFATPDTISALHTWASFDVARIDNVIVPHGSGCEVMLTFAFAEAASEHSRCVLGGMDTAMRSCLKPNIQTFSISFKRFEEMISFADKTFLDTYIWQPLKNR